MNTTKLQEAVGLKNPRVQKGVLIMGGVLLFAAGFGFRAWTVNTNDVHTDEGTCALTQDANQPIETIEDEMAVVVEEDLQEEVSKEVGRCGLDCLSGIQVCSPGVVEETAPIISMSWPTDLRVFTQYYGGPGNHTGVDIDCGDDNKNYAAADGIVTFAGWKGGYGYAIEIDHAEGLSTLYGQNAELYVSAGDTVQAGEAISLCGTTGRSTGTHLHFEVNWNGEHQNPLLYIK